jgi:hypothetical protein
VAAYICLYFLPFVDWRQGKPANQDLNYDDLENHRTATSIGKGCSDQTHAVDHFGVLSSRS